MTRFRLQAGFVAALLVLCAAGALAAQHTVTVPFVANGVGTLTLGPGGKFYLDAAGNATHLGRYTATGVQTFQLGMPPTFVGDVTMVAANGDELYVTVTGVLTGFPPFPAGEGEYEITGGTGRLEGASGTGTFSASSEGTRYEGFIRFAPGR